MFPEQPIQLIYDHRHHWQYLVRRLQPFTWGLAAWIGCLVFWILLAADGNGPAVLTPLGLMLLLWCFGQALIFANAYIDWLHRHIRLYSDGHVEYEHGIFRCEGKTVQMRFGLVRFRYRDRFSQYLDCGDVFLPFDGGILEDIPHFRLFWNLSQGRA